MPYKIINMSLDHLSLSEDSNTVVSNNIVLNPPFGESNEIRILESENIQRMTDILSSVGMTPSHSDQQDMGRDDLSNFALADDKSNARVPEQYVGNIAKRILKYKKNVAKQAILVGLSQHSKYIY